MHNYLKPRINNIIIILKNDLDLIAGKRKDDEWKRDQYRYTFTLAVQRMYDLLNSNLTVNQMSPVSQSTKSELIALRDRIDKMLEG